MASIQENYDFYKGIYAMISSEHPGQFVVIHDKTVIGYYPSREEALKRAAAQFALGTFIIQEIDIDIDTPEYFSYRVAFA